MMYLCKAIVLYLGYCQEVPGGVYDDMRLYGDNLAYCGYILGYNKSCSRCSHYHCPSGAIILAVEHEALICSRRGEESQTCISVAS